MKDGATTDWYLGLPAVICSPPMQEVLRLVQRVAQSDATVLIVGETGTGKELVARALHHYSLRHTKPWVDINCASLPEHLIESELFGFEKGAFSGADSAKPGLFELAHTGTLFLDEIGELDRRVQVKLLRVLDGVSYYRLGGVRKITVNVRIVAATNQDLEEDTHAGTFRRDLFHRLSQIRIRVPPLRERREDILPLARFFLERHGPDYCLSRDAEQCLLRRAWPGNVRELRNVVDKAAVLAEAREIRPADLALENTATAAEPAEQHRTLNLDGMERSLIFRALNESRGHHQKAAEMLGISRRTLSRKLKTYSLEGAGESCVV